PWAVVASLAFVPEIVLPTLDHMNAVYPAIAGRYGFKSSFNPTFAQASAAGQPWISKDYCGLEQGSVVLMLENYFSSFVWRQMQQRPYMVTGLRQAGFINGWL